MAKHSEGQVPRASVNDTSTRLAVRLSKPLYTRLMTEADARMVAPSLLAEKAISKFLDELKPLDEQLAIVE